MQHTQSQQFRSALSLLWNSLIHVTIILLAIGIAFSLPGLAEFVLYKWWPQVQMDTKWLLVTEISLSAALILLFNIMKIAWDNRSILAAAKLASLVDAADASASPRRWRARRLMKRSSAARDVFALTLTGFDTFVKQNSPFNGALASAYEIRIMLLNPNCETVTRRVNAISDQNVNPQSLREEVAASVAYLTSLHKLGKKVRLKFYDHEPIWKVVVLGDRVWVQHCHREYEIKHQAEYVFALQADAPRRGFFVPFYTYFLDHWNEPHHPEYDFDTSELTYRDKTGNEIRRVPLHDSNDLADPHTPSSAIRAPDHSMATFGPQ